MDANQFREILAEFSLSQVDFARLVGVTARTINQWATDNRDVPGPAVAYLNLLRSLPKALLVQELSKLKESPPMYDGMYQFTFQGSSGFGIGFLVLMAGRVFGSDGGVLYDGSYEPNAVKPGCADLHLKITVPPGVRLVQGVPPQSMTYSFDLGGTIRGRGTTELNVDTPYGLVRAVVSFVRELPTQLAA
jgi:DNA-binding XRE family transcriptional regulator